MDILSNFMDCEKQMRQRIFEENCQDPIMGPIFRHIGRDWFVSVEEAEYWYKLIKLPNPGHDSAMEMGLEE